jgi:DNA-binding transcriptional MerR regulator
LIRYWEKEFGTLRPKRTGKGDRLVHKKDIEQLQRIQHLVKEKGFTLQGAREQLRKVDRKWSPLAHSTWKDCAIGCWRSVRKLVTLRENVQPALNNEPHSPGSSSRSPKRPLPRW